MSKALFMHCVKSMNSVSFLDLEGAKEKGKESGRKRVVFTLSHC